MGTAYNEIWHSFFRLDLMELGQYKWLSSYLLKVGKKTWGTSGKWKHMLNETMSELITSAVSAYVEFQLNRKLNKELLFITKTDCPGYDGK